MTPRRKKRLMLVIALLIGVAGSVGLILFALNQNMNLFYTPTQLVQTGIDGVKPHVGQRLRIGGIVEPGSVTRSPNSLDITFKLTVGGPSVTVEYGGILPDLFRVGQGIIAQGVLVNATTVKATEVLAKHDESYMPPEIAEAMKKSHMKLEYTHEQTQGIMK
jgi:cytochrome c-type biogenesis protein CcmE